MQSHHASLLAQVIPVIGVALIVEMHQLEPHIVKMHQLEPRATSPAGTEFKLAKHVPQILAALFIPTIAALAVSEMLCLWTAASDGELHGVGEATVWGSLGFAMVMTFLIPPSAWFWRLYSKTQRKVIGTTVITATGAVGVILVSIFGEHSRYYMPTVFQSGDRPHIDTETSGGCLSPGACSFSTREKSYSWELDPRAQRTVRATFIDESGSYDNESVTGTFGYLATNCPGAHLEWTLQVDGSALRSGVLDNASGEVAINEPVTKQPGKAEISVRRTDDQPCGVRFRWDNPRFASD